MKRVKITAIAQVWHEDLIEKYEAPGSFGCEMKIGQEFIVTGHGRPEGLCESAWENIREYAMILAYGGTDIYSGWMKDEKTAVISCNDGLHPMSFLLEVID